MDSNQMPAFKRDSETKTDQQTPETEDLQTDKTSSNLQKTQEENTVATERQDSDSTTHPVVKREDIVIREEYQEKIRKMSERYLKLHHFIFGQGIWIIFLLIAFFIAIFLSQTSAKTQSTQVTRTPEKIQEEQRVAAKINFIDTNHDTIKDIVVVAENGKIILDEKQLISLDNLLSYQGFVIPRRSAINLQKLKTMSSAVDFANGSYKIQDIDKFLSIFVFDGRSSQSPENNISMIKLGADTKLINYFGLQCIFYPDLPGNFCHNSINSFIKSFKYYDVSQDYEGLQAIGKRLTKSSQSDEFCQELSNYVFISHDTGPEIKEIINECGSFYVKSIDEFDGFITIQEQIEKGNLTTTLSERNLVNNYKLLSSMQEIAYEIQRGDYINIVHIESYGNYVQALLKHPDRTLKYYFDLIARFNNGFLIAAIEAKIAQGGNNSKYKTLLSNIKKLNVGDKRSNTPPLDEFVSDPRLVSEGFEMTEDIKQEEESLTKRIEKQFGSDSIIFETITETPSATIQVSGLIRGLRELGIANNSPLTMEMKEEKGFFNIISINLSRNQELASALKKIIQDRGLQLSELSQTLQDTQKALTLNKGFEGDICTTFSGKDMISCDQNSIVFEKNNIRYDITYDIKKGVLSYEVSNDDIQKQFRETYGMPIFITTNPEQGIQLLLGFQPTVKNPDKEEPDDSPSGGFANVQIQRDIADIGSRLTNTTRDGDHYKVEFTHKKSGKVFVADYVYENRSIIKLWVKDRGKEQLLRNVFIDFKDISQSDKNLFANDLASFLLPFDPISVKQYRF